MIWKITNYFYGVDKNDLFQAGVVGLFKALKNYHKNNTTKFSTFAYEYIFGEMYVLASNKNIKISKDILKLYKKIEEARYYLAQKLYHIPSNKELSLYLNIPISSIELAILANKKTISLDYENDDNDNLYNIVNNNIDYDLEILLNDSINILNKEEQDIIKKRYFEDLTQSEVAKKLKMTQVMVSRYEKKSIKKMRDYLTL